ncbi:hypothetical protein [Micromonospora sp. ATA51]|nr:hypothetical protein [Micromonospora sp. ATA51]MBM0225181.1 hypothetical protein [Micromonospora sp. ATA51]
MAFDTGYECGRADEAKRHQVRDEQITRLARAPTRRPTATRACSPS